MSNKPLNPHLRQTNVTSSVFINPNGVLCKTVVLLGKARFTMINVQPRFDGYDVNGNIINLNDWCYEHCL
jgi:hypothetical protein